MRYAVLGAGLIGSAAARHLAALGHDVTLIGPGEPQDWASHNGVFGSHYDEGRITRKLDFMPFWAEVSARSIARYEEIEAASEIPFFTEVGGMMAAPDMAAVATNGSAQGVDFQELKTREAAAFGFALPEHVSVLHEPREAGHISPRRLVAAQQKAFYRLGGHRIDAVVTAAHRGRVESDRGRFDFDQVLWAAGGFGAPHLDLPLNVQGRTIVFFEVPGDWAQAAKMPTLILEDGVDVDIYLLPPIQYPDGRWYLKIGGGPHDRPLATQDDMRGWFLSGGDPEAARALSDVFHRLVPNAPVVAEHFKPCVTTYLPDDLPAIGRLDDQTCVATAGNGRGAKCSDELGRLGATALLGDVVPELDPLRFAGRGL